MLDIFIYEVDLPPGVHEMVSPCQDGFTIYVDAGDTMENRRRHFEHAIKHILKKDHEQTDVQEIEERCHDDI